MWSEIEIVLKENRHELILQGAEISNRIENDGIDQNLYKCVSLNFLRICDTNLEEIPENIAKLINLKTLLLHSNKISTVTDQIGELSNLKILDLSNNSLTNLSTNISKLHNVTTLNLSSNKLENFPNISDLSKISLLDLSNNNLVEFPDICYSTLTLLSELKLQNNKIIEIPANINDLSGLKILDLSSNQIKLIPGELSDCVKLKDLNLKENPIQDKRLNKLIEQCRTKQIIDYIKQHCVSKTGPKNSKKKGRNKNDSQTDIAKPEEKQLPTMIVTKVSDEQKVPDIKITEHVKKVRSFIVACIVKDLKFDENSFRKFIQLQTKLHDNICEKRTLATIATHDLKKLLPSNLNQEQSKCDLLYTAKNPDELKIQPLGRNQLFSGTRLFQQLQAEAENLRKEKKRNAYSGIHKYLHLLEGCPLFPCLCDANGDVISFPPITNSEKTRISVETTDIFVEVTSNSNLDTCKRIMETILREMLALQISEGPDVLKLQRVRVIDVEGNLKGLFPSKYDLIYSGEHINIVRE